MGFQSNRNSAAYLNKANTRLVTLENCDDDIYLRLLSRVVPNEIRNSHHVFTFDQTRATPFRDGVQSVPAKSHRRQNKFYTLQIDVLIRSWASFAVNIFSSMHPN